MIAITGATGQLGQLVVNELKNRTSAANLVALVRNPSKAEGLGIAARAFDYTKPETLAASLAGVDKLLLISSNEIGQRATQHANVIAAAKAAGVKLFVYTSLLHADSSTLSLADEHRQTEAALKASGLNYVILRNGWYTENYTASIPGALAGGAFLGSAEEGRIASAARADYAAAAAVVLSSEGHAGKTYELAGDSSYTLTELAAELSRQSGKQIPYKNLPAAEYAAILVQVGLPEGLAQALAGWDAEVAHGVLFDDSKQLAHLIGRPSTSLAESIKAALRS